MTEKIKQSYTMMELRQYLISHENVNIQELLDKGNKDFDKQEVVNKNRFSVTVMALLGYKTMYNAPKREYRELITESIESLKAKNKNEQINRILGYLHSKGLSPYTNMERAIQNLEKDVLAYSKEEWDNRFGIYLDNYQHDIYKKEQGNETIFKNGIRPDISLSQAMCVGCCNRKLWLDYLELYFEHLKENRFIDFETIVCLNYFYSAIIGKTDILAANIYFTILAYFDNLEIKGNVNKYDEYWKFLKNYVLLIANFGYVETREATDIGNLTYDKNHNIVDNIYRDPEFIEKFIFKPIIKRLHDLYDKIEVDVITNPVKEIEAFLFKNLELMKANAEVALRKPKIETNIRTAYINEQEVKALIAKKDKMNNNEWNNMLLKALQEGKITPYEYTEILKM